MVVVYPAFNNLKRQNETFEEQGVGSLQSYYEEGVESEPLKKIKTTLHNPCEGPLNLFPEMDRYTEDASSSNIAPPQVYGLRPQYKLMQVDATALIYEETLGKFNGFRWNNDIGFKDEPISNCRMSSLDDVLEINGADIDEFNGQANFGHHADADASIEKLAASEANQSKMGFSSLHHGRSHGFERTFNPAINDGDAKAGSELVYTNTYDLPINAPSAVPMDVDVIQVNGKDVTVADTLTALDNNIS
jgi:hypothetical protein